jgi:hypothetical protein
MTGGFIRRNLFLSLGALAGLLGANQAMAQTPGFSYNGSVNGGTQNRTATNQTFGEKFVVGSSNLSVSALGVQDNSVGGLAGTNTTGSALLTNGGGTNNALEVGVWNSTGTLLASANILGTDPESASYVYDSNLSAPLQLLSGQTYFIGAFATTGVLPWVISNNNTGPNYFAASSLSFASGSSSFFNGSGFNATVGGGNPGGAWGPANFLATTPEPASLGLLCLGGLPLLARRRRA